MSGEFACCLNYFKSVVLCYSPHMLYFSLYSHKDALQDMLKYPGQITGCSGYSRPEVCPPVVEIEDDMAPEEAAQLPHLVLHLLPHLLTKDCFTHRYGSPGQKG